MQYDITFYDGMTFGKLEDYMQAKDKVDVYVNNERIAEDLTLLEFAEFCQLPEEDRRKNIQLCLEVEVCNQNALYGYQSFICKNNEDDEGELLAERYGVSSGLWNYVDWDRLVKDNSCEHHYTADYIFSK